MFLSLVRIFALSFIVYLFPINMAINETEKVYIKLNKFFKVLFGFWIYDTNRFGLKSIVFQSGNIIGTVIAITVFLSEKNIHLAFKYQGYLFFATLLITGIVAVFVNRW